MDRIIFDYSRLKGRIIEKFGSQRAFAEKLGISESTLTQKLNGNSYFSQGELMRSAALLGVAPAIMSEYFFTEKV